VEYLPKARLRSASSLGWDGWDNNTYANKGGVVEQTPTGGYIRGTTPLRVGFGWDIRPALNEVVGIRLTYLFDSERHAQFFLAVYIQNYFIITPWPILARIQ
jgi:hypothetical protein